MITELQQQNDSVEFANIYQAEGRETLRAVGVTDSRGQGESVEIVTEVYRLQDNSDPKNGELVSSQTDRIDQMLYSVIELDTPVELEEGEYFSVVQTMRLLTPGYEMLLLPLEFGSENPIYVGGYDGVSSYYQNYKVLCGEGESFLYFSQGDGEPAAWMDLSSEEAKEYFRVPINDGSGNENYLTVGNAMIKAYTIETETILSLSNETPVLICYDTEGNEIARLQDQELSGSVSVPWNAAAVSVELSEGSGTALSITFEGETFSSGEQIKREVFENREGILTLSGYDRGEQASREYRLMFAIGEASAVDKTALLEKIAEAEKISGEGYTAESYRTLQEAIAAALAVANDENASLEEVNTALAALDAAVRGLAPTESGEPVFVAVNDPGTGSTKTAQGVKTGDPASPVLPAAALAASLLVIAGTAAVMKKKNYR